jgi:hypothetical protein
MEAKFNARSICLLSKICCPPKQKSFSGSFLNFYFRVDHKQHSFSSVDGKDERSEFELWLFAGEARINVEATKYMSLLRFD